MVRNLAGLKRSAQVAQRRMRCQRATAAIRLMQSEEVEINFRSVATRAERLDGLALRNEVRCGTKL